MSEELAQKHKIIDSFYAGEMIKEFPL